MAAVPIYDWINSTLLYHPIGLCLVLGCLLLVIAHLARRNGIVSAQYAQGPNGAASDNIPYISAPPHLAYQSIFSSIATRQLGISSETWIQGILETASSLTYLHIFTQMASPTNRTHRADWSISLYQAAQLLSLVMQQDFSSKPFLSLCNRVEAGIIVGVLHDILRHYDLYISRLGRSIIAKGSQSAFPKLTRLLFEVAYMYDIVPSDLLANGLKLGRDPVCGGGYADIYKCTLNGSEVAVKKLRPAVLKCNIRRALFREAATWAYLEHNNILPFLGIYKEESEEHSLFCIVSPWVERGSVRDYMSKIPLDPDEVGNWLLDAAHGLEYLHSRGVVHGDVRGSNILIDKGGKAVIADFGQAHLLDVLGRKVSSGDGSYFWMAPELLTGQEELVGRTFASDVYAYACTCVELYTGREPCLSDIILTFSQGKRSVPSDVKSIPTGVLELIDKCWSSNPDHRPSMDSVICAMITAIRHQSTDSFRP